jgi:ribosomal-protein-serine acetyltransferase
MFYEDELVGNISFNTINHDLKKVEIGYWLREQFRGKGIVTRSVSKLIDMAFRELNMQKVQISAAVDNAPSRNVCKRLGFNLEGIITCAENLNGKHIMLLSLTQISRSEIKIPTVITVGIFHSSNRY